MTRHSLLRLRSALPALLALSAWACAMPAAKREPPDAFGAAQATPRPPEDLRLTAPVEGRLSPGERHEFAVSLTAGDYLRIVARSQTMDLALQLLAPDGALLAAADGPAGSKRPELLSLVTDRTARARLVVTRRDQGAVAPYRLVLEEQRAAVATDRARVAAEAALARAVHLRSLGSAEAMAEAGPLLEKTLDLWRQANEQRGEVDTLIQLGAWHRVRGEGEQVREAVRLAERARDLAQQIGYVRGEAEALNDLALALSRLDKPEAALPPYQQALALWEQLGDTEERARTLYNIGAFYLNRGQMALAREHFELSLTLRREAGDVAGQAWVLNGLGIVHYWLGETKEALDCSEQALSLARETGERRLEAAVINSLAGIHRRRGELQQALQLYLDALAANRALQDPSSEARVLEALGGFYLELGDLEKAGESFRLALRRYREQKNVTFEAAVRSSIAAVHALEGDFAAAVTEYRAALDLARQVGSPAAEGRALLGLGVALSEQGDLAAALDALEEALAVRREHGDRSQEGATLLEIGAVQQRMGKAAAAAESYRAALDLARQGEDLALVAACLLRWAALNRDGGDLVAAREQIEEALRVVESVRQQFATGDLRTTFLASRRSYYDLYIDLLLRLHARDPAGGHQRLAFEASERSRARGLLELLAEARVEVRRGIDPELREEEARLADRSAWLRSTLQSEAATPAPRPEEVARLREELSLVEAEQQRLEIGIRMRHPRYAEVRYPQPAEIGAVQALLDNDTALLQYSLGTESSALFVVTRNALHSFPLPAAGAIERDVTALREVLASRSRQRLGAFVLAARGLYDELIAPAAEILRGKSNLLISPDRSLYLLPFEVLIGDGDSRSADWRLFDYLLRSHRVSYVPSASVLRGLTEQAPGEAAGGAVPAFVGFADPVYAPEMGMPPLPASRGEVLRIASLYDPSRIATFIGPEATERNVKHSPAVRSARRLHFATHGFLAAPHSDRFGLVLGDGARSGDDGVLRVYEVFDLELSAELVVLSACDTGLGLEVAGEGLVGLSRAFFYAGSRSLVVSLWQVADVSSPDLMVEFYRLLGEGHDRAEALRRAKLAALSHGRWPHPFHWASFILLGSPGDVRNIERAVSPVHSTIVQAFP